MKPCRRIAASLLLFASPAAAAQTPPPVQEVTVSATDYRFVPDRLSLRRGVAYRLHVENRGTELHEFHAAELFKSSQIRNPEVLTPDRSEIQVRPRTAADLYFVPERPGRYKFYCPDHDWEGMTGGITVK